MGVDARRREPLRLARGRTLTAATPRGEFQWIDRLVEILGPVASAAGASTAIGDDVAVLRGPGGETWAWTIDGLVERVHFRFDWMEPEDVGYRALAASLSDLAAAIAEPLGALVTVAGAPGAIDAHLEGIYRGIADLAGRTRCPIVGGDLSRSDGPLHLTVTAIGRCRRDPPGRGGAKPGDELWVTGRLGAPAAALDLLTRADADPARLADARAHPSAARLARPTPRLAESAWLAESASLHALIDVSDGISSDAGHLAERSGVRIALEPARIPVHPAALDAARRTGSDPVHGALHGGEEFELLFAAPGGAIAPLADPFEERFGIPLTRIGAVEPGAGLVRRGSGGDIPLEPGGWDHFRVASPGAPR
ncbi:MAG TPA: thiamine-phosphate kinase [Gemmatimonadota bacterium]